VSAPALRPDGDPAGDPRPRVAIVTGAATGIGAATALALARAGLSVVVNHLDSPAKAAAVVKSLRETGAQGIAVQADVGSREQHEALVRATVEAFGRWDVLVANAAWAPTRPLVDFREPDLDAVWAVNVKALVWGMQLAREQMADGGRIVGISSSTTALMLAGYSVYDASKAAAEQLVRIYAHEIADRSITVNAVAPGATATEAYAAGRGEDLVRRFAAMSAFGRLGTVDEIADVVVFLASPAARWITGQVIRVNGGTA
jgi:3-oxoacyl-[acyl-carrier protein] reductase